MEQSDDVRVLHEEIEYLKEHNQQLSDELQRAAERCTLPCQIVAAAGRVWRDILYWKFVVLILAVEAIRLGIDIARLGR